MSTSKLWLRFSLVLASSFPSASAFFRMPCAGPLVQERADPIVNPGEISPHLHTIMGGNAFDFNMTYADARKGTCSTCMVKQDMSNYWVPNLFYKAQNGSFTPVSQNGMTVYYLQRRANSTEELHPFPEGFRMLAGSPTARNFTGSLASKAVTYACLGTSNPQTNNIPDYDCPDGLRSQVFFPSCWDGKNVDSPDHMSHVAYPDGVDSGKCPSTHPVRLISIFYEVLWGVTQFKDMWYSNGDSKHPFVFSMGDATGYGYHGDFVNGWDTATLTQAVQNCNAESGVIEECGNILEFFTQDEMNNCFKPTQVDEQTTGWMDKLPGCNPVTYGPEPATAGKDCTGVTTKISAPKLTYTDMTSNGWTYVGCVLDSLDARVLPTRYAKDDMTVEMCMKYCDSQGASYAGVEYSEECYCGTAVASDVLASVNNKCEMMCAGNSTEFCGDSAKLSLYKKGSSTSTSATSQAEGSASAGTATSSRRRRHVQRHVYRDSFIL